ncbi:porphobilinogen synthase [Holophaga foetida]|uniref:porphobilinogen synthase n=1 Tax=Holophaga foetida TaxID=35839 RepID=UPI0002473B03|nr:porphobilinogen synthase [Holophaga foetida]
MFIRPRRLRRTKAIRDLVAETDLRARHLIQPYFVQDAEGVSPIASLPGIARTGLQATLKQVEADLKLGLRSVVLFGVPDTKSPLAEHSHDPKGSLPRTISALKQAFGDDLIVMTDVCLCAYTDHGHCGVVENGEIVNDASVAILAEMALTHAQAGADVVSPSDMMDGRVAAIRARLDEEGFQNTAILSYAIKHNGAYYGPFREAADSSPKFGDRRTYQMDPRNAREGIKDALLDIEEGADILMVKPGIHNLDLIWRLREACLLPICSYHVSSEFSSVKAADQLGWVNGDQLLYEQLLSLRRAGSDMIITYAAREAVQKGWTA